VVFTAAVDQCLKEVCLEISKRYEVTFVEIGTDQDHVHFLVQSAPMYSPKRIVQIIKSITAREIFRQCPEVKSKLWGGEFWSDGYFVSTVGNTAMKKASRSTSNDRAYNTRRYIGNNSVFSDTPQLAAG
jgi:REP element-mobilizing transposase RayT